MFRYLLFFTFLTFMCTTPLLVTAQMESSHYQIEEDSIQGGELGQSRGSLEVHNDSDTQPEKPNVDENILLAGALALGVTVISVWAVWYWRKR